MFACRAVAGRSLSLLDPTYASKYIPIIASVSEHQPPSWPSYFTDLQACCPACRFCNLRTGSLASVRQLAACFKPGCLLPRLFTVSICHVQSRGST